MVLAPLAAEQSSQRRATMADDSEDDEPAFDLFDDAVRRPAGAWRRASESACKSIISILVTGRHALLLLTC